jgi:hypothetical protein
MEIPDIKIYGYPEIKDNKLKFESYNEVEGLVKNNLYDNLKLELIQEVELRPDQSPIYGENDKRIKRAIRVESYIAFLKYAKVIDYEHSSEENETISSHKYNIIAQEIIIKKNPFEIDTLYMSK